MGEGTKIEWTEGGNTFNPWIGCSKTSAGCTNCYAERMMKRIGQGNLWSKEGPRRKTKPAYWKQPLEWDAEAKKTGVRKKVFCGSMCDWLDPVVPIEWRLELMDLIALTPNLDWLLLTKQNEILAELPVFFLDNPNAWAGVTIENQENYKRVNDIPLDATVRFVSVEPMLGPILFDPCDLQYIDWVICGGESGTGVRPFDVEWARKLIKQCQEHDVAFFMKQIGSRPYDSTLPLLARMPSREILSGNTLTITDFQGLKTDEWPKEIRVKKFPRSRR